MTRPASKTSKTHVVVLHAMPDGRFAPVARIKAGDPERSTLEGLAAKAVKATSPKDGSPWTHDPKAKPLVAHGRPTRAGDMVVIETDGVAARAFQVLDDGLKATTIPPYESESSRKGALGRALAAASRDLPACEAALGRLRDGADSKGRIKLWVGRHELVDDAITDAADTPMARFIAENKQAVAQPFFVQPRRGAPYATGGRSRGEDGLAFLAKTFGRPAYRGLELDAGVIAAAIVADPAQAPRRTDALKAALDAHEHRAAFIGRLELDRTQGYREATRHERERA